MTPDRVGNWGIMGGVFDPIHNAHLALAEYARESYKLSGVLFVVSFNPPHRSQKPVAPFEDRLRMTALAVEGNEFFEVSAIERELEGPGYTLSIVEKLKAKYPEAVWHLILGADNIVAFDSWHKPDELIKKIKILVGGRPGFNDRLQYSKWVEDSGLFEMPLMEISSTLIRQRLSRKKSIRYLLPDNVIDYIEKKGLYR
jgi:nicotinate-nucleotide adenylyltransferase